MKSLKRLIALGICGVSVGALFSACGGDRGNSIGGGEVDTTKDGGAYTDVVDEADISSITVFKNDWAQFNEARQKNSPVYQKLKSVIGCDIEAINSSSATWENQLGLLQADKDMPDIFLTNGPDNPEFFNRLIRNGDVISISDWVSEEHYPNIYNYMKQFDYMRHNVSYAQGKSWFIPSSWHNEKSLYVRRDWIDNLNGKLASCLVKEGVIASEGEMTEEIRAEWEYKVPGTLLEFYRLARAFTLYDPDGNGSDDTCGYFSESNKDMDAWIYNAFDAGWNQFVYDEETKEYTYSDINDSSLYATAFISRLITDGYMSIDSLTADNGTKQDKLVQGKAGMIYAHNWLNNFVSGIMAVDKTLTVEQATAKIAMCDPPAGRDGAWNGAGAAGYWQGFCINANMSKSRIRKCLELYDYLLGEEGYELMQYGVKDVHYSVDESGKKTNLLNKNESGFYPSIVSEDTATMLYALVDWTMHYRSTVATNADIIVPREVRSEAHSKLSDYPCVQTEASVDYLEDCHKLFYEVIVEIEKNEGERYVSKTSSYNPKTFGWEELYTVSKTCRSKWSSFVKSFKNAGGADILEEYNAYIASGKAKKAS